MLIVVDSKFNFLSFKKNSKSSSSSFQVSGDGSIHSSGYMNLFGDNLLGITVKTGLSSFGGGLSLNKHIVSANEEILIPSAASYVVISNDNITKVNKLVFESISDLSIDALALFVGRIVIISNLDDQDTTGAANIPAQSTVMFVYDGHEYVDIQALKSPIQELRRIKSFEAANDLDIGNFSFTAEQLRSNRLSKGRIPIVGAQGDCSIVYLVCVYNYIVCHMKEL